MNSKKPMTEKTFRKSYLLMIGSLVAAIILWYFVVDSTNPVLSRTFADVPVEILNQDGLRERELAAPEELQEFVNVKVSGKRSSILALKESELVPALDLSECTEGDNYVEVKVHTPDSVEVESVSRPQIRVVLEKIVTEESPVKVAFSGALAGNLEPVCLGQEIDTVEVTGAKSQVLKVDHAAASLDVALLDKKKDVYTVALTPVDKNGNQVDNVTLNREDAEVTAQIYAVKSLSLKVERDGELPAGLSLISVEAPEQIDVAMQEDLTDTVSEIRTKPLHLSEINGNTTVDLELQLPDGVKLAKGQDAPKAVITVVKTDNNQ